MTFQEIPWPKSASVLIGSFQMAQNLDVTQDCEKCKITKKGWFYQILQILKISHKTVPQIIALSVQKKIICINVQVITNTIFFSNF